MSTAVTMPRLGESVAEGTIGSWLKQEGDYVEKDEALVEIVTDKINAELPSPVAGRVSKILVPVDETVAVGTEIVLIEEDASVTDTPAEKAPEAAPGPDAAPVESEEQAATPVMEPVAAGARQSYGVDGERQRVSPLARRLAREHSVDLNDIAGTGINGRVRKEDILAYVAQREAAPARRQAPQVEQPVATPAPATQRAAVATVAGSDEELIEPSRMRLAIAEHMVRSKRTSPHATAMLEVDMTNIAKWLTHNKDEFKKREGYSMSFVPFVIKATCEGLRKVPEMNSSWTEDNNLLIKKRINMGIAIATDAGLVVPTLYDADQYTLAGLAKQVNALAQRARANKLTLQDMQGSTFVVNNTGVFGTIISIPIINQPHAGILAMNAVVKRPVVIEDDAIAVRSMMYLCLSFDHRILDGAGSGTFLQTIKNRLESYGREIDVY
jgi:2-oxoglutarate dehydrogenase complex dihydrolipoamide succinyltransferase (E2) component